MCLEVGQCGKKEAGVSTRGPLEILGGVEGWTIGDIGQTPDLSASLIQSSHGLLCLFIYQIPFTRCSNGNILNVNSPMVLYRQNVLLFWGVGFNI